MHIQINAKRRHNDATITGNTNQDIKEQNGKREGHNLVGTPLNSSQRS